LRSSDSSLLDVEVAVTTGARTVGNKTTTLHDVTTQVAVIWILTDVAPWNIASCESNYFAISCPNIYEQWQKSVHRAQDKL